MKVKKSITISKTRRLPLPGEVLVEKGQKVDFDTVVARTLVPGKPNILRASDLLGIEPEDLLPYTVKKKGESVEKDEIVAKYIALFGLFKRFATSPVNGVIEEISESTGRIVIREHPVPVEVKAYIPGKVVDVLPNEGAVIETNASFIQGIFGVGGETHGSLRAVVESPREVITTEKIRSEHEGMILFGGSHVSSEALKKAIEVGVKGIIVGCIDDEDLAKFLGYEIGVALTGEEDIKLTLIITEGFGRIAMSQRIFDLLSSLDGKEAVVNGATQIRAGVLRPEIIVPQPEVDLTSTVDDYITMGMIPGTKVRIIREPLFGMIGTVVSLPINLQKIETESDVRVLNVELEDGTQATVPRANVEIIEE